MTVAARKVLQEMSISIDIGNVIKLVNVGLTTF